MANIKPALLLFLALLITACSKPKGSLSLSCYGTNNNNIAGITKSKDETRNYSFVDKKLEGYSCEWNSNGIYCYSQKDNIEKPSGNYFIYDKKTGSFVETKVATHIDRAVFIGKCSEPMF